MEQKTEQLREEMPYWLSCEFEKYEGANDRSIRAEMVSKNIEKYALPKRFVLDAWSFFNELADSSVKLRQGLSSNKYAQNHIETIKPFLVEERR